MHSETLGQSAKGADVPLNSTPRGEARGGHSDSKRSPLQDQGTTAHTPVPSNGVPTVIESPFICHM
jgi:hypothetical protein